MDMATRARPLRTSYPHKLDVTNPDCCANMHGMIENIVIQNMGSSFHRILCVFVVFPRFFVAGNELNALQHELRTKVLLLSHFVVSFMGV